MYDRPMWPQLSHFSSTCGCGYGTAGGGCQQESSVMFSERRAAAPRRGGGEGRGGRRTTGSALSWSSSSALTTSARLALSADGKADGFEYVLTPRFSYAERAAGRPSEGVSERRAERGGDRLTGRTLGGLLVRTLLARDDVLVAREVEQRRADGAEEERADELGLRAGRHCCEVRREGLGAGSSEGGPGTAGARRKEREGREGRRWSWRRGSGSAGFEEGTREGGWVVSVSRQGRAEATQAPAKVWPSSGERGKPVGLSPKFKPDGTKFPQPDRTSTSLGEQCRTPLEAALCSGSL